MSLATEMAINEYKFLGDSNKENVMYIWNKLLLNCHICLIFTMTSVIYFFLTNEDLTVI